MTIDKLAANPNKIEYMLIGHPLKVNKLDISELLMQSNSELEFAEKTKSLAIIVSGGLK